MEIQKLPFEITPQIKRYLEEISNFNNEFFARDPKKVFTKESYLANEKPTHRSEESNQNFWKYLQENKAIKLVGKPFLKMVYYSDVDEGVLVPFQYRFKILDIKLIEEILESIELEEKRLQHKNESIGPEYSRPSRVIFDNMENILLYRNIKPYGFHQGIKGEPPPPRLRLFLSLWRERRCIKNRKVELEGKFLDSAALAVQLEITDSAHKYNTSKEVRDNLYRMVKDLRKALRGRGFPIDIIKKNGYQLIVKE